MSRPTSHAKSTENNKEALLQSEILALEEAIQELNKQLVPVDRVREQLKQEHFAHLKTQEKAQSFEKQCKTLTSQVSELRAQLDAQNKETEKHSDRCLELQKICSALSEREHSVHVQLLRAQDREKLSHAASVELHTGIAEAENFTRQALDKVLVKEHELTSLRADLSALGEHAAGGREELLLVRTELFALKETHAQLKAQHGELQERYSVQHSALGEALGQVESLRSRIVSLEDELASSKVRSEGLQEEVQQAASRAREVERQHDARIVVLKADLKRTQERFKAVLQGKKVEAPIEPPGSKATEADPELPAPAKAAPTQVLAQDEEVLRTPGCFKSMFKEAVLALQPDRLALRPALPAELVAAGSGNHSPRSGRNAMADRDLPLLAKHLQQEIASLPSRREYPRCAAARQLRGRILSKGDGPLFASGPAGSEQ